MASTPVPLLIHVGRHKTGSTSVQQCLQALEHPLGRLGVLYPHTGRLGGQHLLWPASALGTHPAVPPEQWCALEALQSALQEEQARRRPRLLMLSSEVFCELAYRQPQACEHLLTQLSSLGPLRLLQVVRPLEGYVVSALKHQLRHDQLLERSPLSWAEHCRRKHQALDQFWVNSGYRLHTLPYGSADAVAPVLQAMLQELGQPQRLPWLLRQRQRLCPQRHNSDALPLALYGLQLLQICSGRARGEQPLPLAALREQLSEALPPLEPTAFRELALLGAAESPEADWQRLQEAPGARELLAWWQARGGE